MLRDEAAGSPALHDVLAQFEIGDESLMDVLSFQKLAENSFLWQLRLTDYVYYMYATDFVDSLDQIASTLQVVTDGTPGELVPAMRAMIFEEASPVTSSSVYEKPDDFDTKIAHYTNESGYDFVFLYRTEQPSEDFEHAF